MSETNGTRAPSDCPISPAPAPVDFDQPAALAAQLCDTPIAVLSLAERQRAPNERHVGLDRPQLDSAKDLFENALRHDPFISVPDAAQDPRFSKHPAVADEPRIRFFSATALLADDGRVLGFLAVASPEPREPSPAQTATLQLLARQTVLEADRSRQRAELDQMRENLRKSQQKYEHLIAAANMAIVIADAETGEVLEVNKKAEELTGFPAARLVGKNRHELHPPETCAVQGDAPLETEICHADGRRIPVEIVSAIAAIDGRKIIQSFLFDLTRRRKREKALHESETRFQAFSDHQPATAWIKDENGRYVYLNKTAVGVYSDGLTQLLGKTDWELFPEAVARQLLENDRRVIESGQSIETVEELPDATGEVRIWQICKFPFRDAEGRLFVGGLGFDITSRRKAENAQRATEDRYRSLVEGARDAIFTISKDGILTSVNQGGVTITGLPREETTGKSFLPLLHPDDVPLALEYMARVLAGEVVHSFDLRILTSKGEYIPMEFTVAPEWQGGEIVGVLGIGRDLRQRRHLEEQLRQMQRLDSIGRLAAGIAHDFNNILTVQKGYLALLLSSGLSGNANELLHQVDLAVERAAGLTRQLLMFSRKQMIQTQPLDLHEVVSHLSKMLDRILGEDVMLQLRCEGSLPPVNADPGMMEQILMNLAVNARDAMPGGGRLTITTETVHFDETTAQRNPETRPGPFVCLTVADTGCGVSPDIIDHMFEPFFTTKDIGKGTGLGLATVHGIVKQHQGWIETESQPGEGTVFRIFLPAAPTQPPDMPEPEASPMPGGDETIFLVEDEPAVREMVHRLLQRCGYTVIACPNGAQARKVWPGIAAKVDLLLTDMVMPEGISGRDLAEDFLKEKPSLKVILTSGYSSELAAGDLGDLGTISFLQKPYLPPELAQIVRDVLDETSNG